MQRFWIPFLSWSKVQTLHSGVSRQICAEKKRIKHSKEKTGIAGSIIKLWSMIITYQHTAFLPRWYMCHNRNIGAWEVCVSHRTEVGRWSWRWSFSCCRFGCFAANIVGKFTGGRSENKNTHLIPICILNLQSKWSLPSGHVVGLALQWGHAIRHGPSGAHIQYRPQSEGKVMQDQNLTVFVRMEEGGVAVPPLEGCWAVGYFAPVIEHSMRTAGGGFCAFRQPRSRKTDFRTWIPLTSGNTDAKNEKTKNT